MKPWWLWLALLGCRSGKPEPLEPVEPMERPSDADEPAPVAPEPLPPAEPELPPRQGPVAIAPACRGDRLDLRALTAGDACVVQHAAEPLPASIAVSLEASAKLRAGAQSTAAIVLTNTSTAEETLLLAHACGRLVDVAYEMLAPSGDRVDLAEGGCGTGRGCSARTLAIALPPKAQLRLPFPLAARVEKFHRDCTSKREAPVPKGMYRLVVYSAFATQTAKITIE